MQPLIKAPLLALFCLLPLFSYAAEPRNMASILSSGELRVGLSLLQPWTMLGKDGKPMGSEVDIAYRLAADMGLQAKLGSYDWDQLTNALNRGDIDIIIAGMTVSPRRALKVNFSSPYASGGIGMAANTALTKNFSSINDIRHSSVNIGAVSGTSSEKIAQRYFSKATLKTFKSDQEAADALLTGELHALVQELPKPQFLALQHPDKIDIPLDKPLHLNREAFAIRKGDQDFLNFLNAWVISRSADGWLENTRNYWFNSLNWRE